MPGAVGYQGARIMRAVSGFRSARATKEAEGVTSLYRAVGSAELKSIQATGMLRNLGSAESKYLTNSGEAASSYDRQAVKAFCDEPYTTVQTNVPNSALRDLLPVSVDRGIPAYVNQNELLISVSYKHLTLPNIA